MKNRTHPGSDAAFARAPGRLLALCIALAAAVAAPGALAQGADKSGHEVVAATCGTCHATGEKNAPKIGESHLLVAGSATSVRMDRYQCNSCHVPQVDARPLVPSTFVGTPPAPRKP